MKVIHGEQYEDRIVDGVEEYEMFDTKPSDFTDNDAVDNYPGKHMGCNQGTGYKWLILNDIRYNINMDKQRLERLYWFSGLLSKMFTENPFSKIVISQIDDDNGHLKLWGDYPTLGTIEQSFAVKTIYGRIAPMWDIMQNYGNFYRPEGLDMAPMTIWLNGTEYAEDFFE